jgi:pilus assembly protein Flp/PilA
MYVQVSRCVQKFLRNEEGPTSVEYAVMLALVISVCLLAISSLGNNANATFKTVGNKLGSASS